MKFYCPAMVAWCAVVAPHWGAWIEIVPPRSSRHSMCRSHPTGVRGLKFAGYSEQRGGDVVAPHWGAWIEIIAAWLAMRDMGSRTPLGCVD